MQRLWRALKRTDGAAMVEFALVLPLLLFIIWGIVDISRAFQTIDSLTSAVREGARAGAVASSRPHTGVTASGIKALVAQDFTPMGAPLDTSLVTVAMDLTSGEVTVSANYQFQALTPLLWAITISRTAAFRWEQTTAP
jgi:Flp pilus assembly protein TadG